MQTRLVLLLATVAAAHGALVWLTAKPAREAPRGGLSIVVRTPRNLSPDAHESEELAARLAAAGIGHAIVQFKQDETDEFEGGLAFYPSAVAPVADGYAADPIRSFMRACEAREIRVSAWVPTLHDPAAVRRHPQWGAAMLAEGETRVEAQPAWLCPRADEAVLYEASILAEIARLYPDLDSMYVDFIRYDGDRSCACARCLAAWGGDAADLDRATHERGRARPWGRWVDERADAIAAVAKCFRAAIDDVRDDLWLGAFVLPFSAVDYDDDTQTGQDYARFADAGIDELVVLGYWDDWEKSPKWARDRVDGARAQLDGDCSLAIALDADQSVLRTRLTLAALDGCAEDVTWFHYDTWTDERLRDLRAAIDGHAREGAPSDPEWFDVAIRVDTEPDCERRYDTVHPEMIETLLDLFEEKGIHATFVTCGKLLELEPRPILEARARGHEIAVHAYDHEQLDELTDAAQIVVLDRALEAFRAAGIAPTGFAAPRNGITDGARRHLLDLGFAWDGSESFDPRVALQDPWEVRAADDRSLIVLPFALPNDWDARRVEGLDAEAMQDRWLDAFDAAFESSSPFFVLDVHQWLVTEPENLEALAAFIDAVRAHPSVRFVTLNDMATDARQRLRGAERALDSKP